MAANQPKKVKALIMYDKEMSKKIYASSDIFIMPSQSEPWSLDHVEFFDDVHLHEGVEDPRRG